MGLGARRGKRTEAEEVFLRKSGAHTEGLGYFHNGNSRVIKKLERGFEMSLISIVNIEERSAYALSMHQSSVSVM